MAAPTALGPAPAAAALQPWTLSTLIAFRFCFVYFGLYCLSTQIITSLLANPLIDFPDPSGIPPWREIVTFTASHIFHIRTPLVFTGSGSGDKTVDFILLTCLLVVSIAATALWSLLDRRRTSYPTLHRWFLLFLRFALAGQMLTYGFAKTVPLQMSFPSLFTLVKPYGDFSPMGVLWSSVGASQHYEIAAGCLELIGGLLLFVPRTVTLGALISLADMSYVFLLNMTYDVPVKLLSFHLILIALLLLAPQFRRLVNFFLLNRTASPAPQAPLFRSPRANRIASVLLTLFALWLIAVNAWGTRQEWKLYGPGKAKPALYGIWNVDQFTLDGQSRPPLLTDTTRWRQIVFDYSTMELEPMNGAPVFYSAAIDSKTGALTLMQSHSKQKLDFAFTRPAPDRLILDGTLNGHKVHMELHAQDLHSFLLVGRGFHWVQEYPFNR